MHKGRVRRANICAYATVLNIKKRVTVLLTHDISSFRTCIYFAARNKQGRMCKSGCEKTTHQTRAHITHCKYIRETNIISCLRQSTNSSHIYNNRRNSPASSRASLRDTPAPARGMCHVSLFLRIGNIGNPQHRQLTNSPFARHGINALRSAERSQNGSEARSRNKRKSY